MSKFKLWFSLFKLRGLTYQITIVLIILSALFMTALALPKLFSLNSTLFIRTPLGQSQLIQVEVDAQHLSKSEQEQLAESPQRVAVHQVKPHLKLVGLGQKLIQDQGQSRLVLGLFPEAAQYLLKSETQFSLRVQAPSVELLIQDLFYSARGQNLQKEMKKSQERLQASWFAFWPNIKTKLANSLPSDLTTRLIQDPVFIDHLKQAFMIEIAARVNLTELSKALENDQALGNLGALAFKNVRWKQIFKELGKGVWMGSKEFSKNTSKTINDEWEQGAFSMDMGYCALSVASVIDPTSLSGVLGSFFELGDSKICSSIRKNAQNIVIRSAKGGGIDLAKQVYGSLSQEWPQASQEAQQVLAHLNQKLKSKVLLKHFWQALSQDQVLIQHLKKEYGEKGLAQIVGALRELSSTQSFSNNIDTLGSELKLIAQKGMNSILLDEQGQGPNPLLLSVIQEQLSGKKRPIVHVYPGQGNTLKPGHRFPHSEQGQIKGQVKP